MSAILWVLEVIFVGHVVVKYKVTLDQPEDGSPNYEGIANVISDFEEVQELSLIHI